MSHTHTQVQYLSSFFFTWTASKNKDEWKHATVLRRVEVSMALLKLRTIIPPIPNNWYRVLRNTITRVFLYWKRRDMKRRAHFKSVLGLEIIWYALFLFCFVLVKIFSCFGSASSGTICTFPYRASWSRRCVCGCGTSTGCLLSVCFFYDLNCPCLFIFSCQCLVFIRTLQSF